MQIQQKTIPAFNERLGKFGGVDGALTPTENKSPASSSSKPARPEPVKRKRANAVSARFEGADDSGDEYKPYTSKKQRNSDK